MADGLVVLTIWPETSDALGALNGWKWPVQAYVFDGVDRLGVGNDLAVWRATGSIGG